MKSNHTTPLPRAPSSVCAMAFTVPQNQGGNPHQLPASLKLLSFQKALLSLPNKMRVFRHGTALSPQNNHALFGLQLFVC